MSRLADRIARSIFKGGDGTTRGWYFGLDLGRVRDRSALVGIETVAPIAQPRNIRYGVRVLHTWPRGCSLLTVAEDLPVLLSAGEILQASGGCTLGFDVGGLGQGFRDQLYGAIPSHVGVLPVTWSSGEHAQPNESGGGWSVPASVAVSELSHILAVQAFTIAADLPDAEQLIAELSAARASFGRRGKVSIELQRDAHGHGDVASACLLAVWLATAGLGDVRDQIRWLEPGAAPRRSPLGQLIQTGRVPADAPPLAPSTTTRALQTHVPTRNPHRR